MLTIVALVSSIACAAPKADAKAKPASAADKAAPAGAAKPEADAKADAKDKPAAPTLSVEKKGSYVYWFTYKDASGAAQATLPVRFKGKSTDLDLSALGVKYSAAKLFVMNRTSGVLAMTDYPVSATTKDVDLTSEDLQYIRNVKLRIVSEDGKPLESAIVRITDGMNAKMSAVVTPADEGVAKFSNVATGETTVKVEAEGLRRTIDSDIEIEPGPTPGYEQDIKVSGDVNTVSVKSKSKEAATAKSKGGGGSVVFALSAIAGLLVIGLIVVIVVVVLKAKGFTGQSALQGLGVEMPGSQNGQPMPGAPAAPAADPNVCPFCGQRKNEAGQCACSVLPGAAAPAAMSSSSAGPRLVGFQGVYSGHIFEIAGGSMLMGRESDNPIPLPNDNTASRRHATISQSNGAYSIRDEGSSNGTFVNGAKITEQTLSSGDEIQVGGTKFRFEL